MVRALFIAGLSVLLILNCYGVDGASRVARSPQFSQANAQAQAGSFGGGPGFGGPGFGGPRFGSRGFGGHEFGRPGFGGGFSDPHRRFGGGGYGPGGGFGHGGGFGNGGGFGREGGGSISISKSISINRGPGSAQSSSNAGGFGK